MVETSRTTSPALFNCKTELLSAISMPLIGGWLVGLMSAGGSSRTDQAVSGVVAAVDPLLEFVRSIRSNVLGEGIQERAAGAKEQVGLVRAKVNLVRLSDSGDLSRFLVAYRAGGRRRQSWCVLQHGVVWTAYVKVPAGIEDDRFTEDTGVQRGADDRRTTRTVGSATEFDYLAGLSNSHRRCRRG